MEMQKNQNNQLSIKAEKKSEDRHYLISRLTINI